MRSRLDGRFLAGTAVAVLSAAWPMFAAACGSGKPVAAPPHGRTPGALASSSLMSCATLSFVPNTPGAHFASQQILSRSLREAQSIHDERQQVSALLSISAAYLKVDRPDRALAIGCEPALSQSTDFARLARPIAVYLAEHGDTDSAARVAMLVEQLPIPVPSTGQPATAPPQIVPPNPIDGSDAWAAIAIAFARAGAMHRWENALRRVHNTRYRGRVQLAAFEAQQARGATEQAWHHLQQARSDAELVCFQDPRQLVEVARRYVDIGRRPEALSLLRKAIPSTTASKWGASVRDELAVGLGALGELDEAIALLHGGEFTAVLAKVLLEAGNIEGARKACDSMSSASLRSRALARSALKASATGANAVAEEAWEAAKASAEAEPFPRFRVESLCELAAAMHQGGRNSALALLLEEARSLALGIEDLSERSMALRDVAIGFARTGRCAEALRIPPGQPGDTSYTVHEIAHACSEPGELDAVEPHVRGIEHADHRGEALGFLAVKYALAGDLPKALELVSRIDGAEQRVAALIAIGLAPLRQQPSD